MTRREQQLTKLASYLGLARQGGKVLKGVWNHGLTDANKRMVSGLWKGIKGHLNRDYNKGVKLLGDVKQEATNWYNKAPGS